MLAVCHKSYPLLNNRGFSCGVRSVLRNAVCHVGVQDFVVSVQEKWLFVLCMAVEEEETETQSVFRISAVIKHQGEQTLYNCPFLAIKNGQEWWELAKSTIKLEHSMWTPFCLLQNCTCEICWHQGFGISLGWRYIYHDVVGLHQNAVCLLVLTVEACVFFSIHVCIKEYILDVKYW